MEEKKSGIAKVLELLNEYEIEKEKTERTDVDVYVEFEWGYTNYNGLTRWDKTDQREGDNLYGDTAVAYLISFSFGFIKWLIEYDKIDFEKVKEKTECKNLAGGWENCDFMVDRWFTPYEEVLMWLSIQDETIEFLCSILK